MRVRRQQPGDTVVENFGPEEWSKIFTDIHSDQELNRFLMRESGLVKTFVLEDYPDGKPFGWIMLRRKDPILCSSVEFHGGSWRHEQEYAWRKFHASCMVIKSLVKNDIRVTSKSLRNNHKALRFLGGIGFRVVDDKSSGATYRLTLRRERFFGSPIYRRLMSTQSPEGCRKRRRRG